MTDPHLTTASTILGAGAGSVTVLLGAQIDALIVGLMAAVFVSIWLDTIDNRIKAAAAVLFSALLAGYGSPVAAEWISGNTPSVASNAEALRLLLALLIGAAAPTIFPLGIKYLGNKINGGQA